MLCLFDVPGIPALKGRQNGHRGEGMCGRGWRGGERRDGGRDAICERRIQKEKNIIWDINKTENERTVSGRKHGCYEKDAL